MAYKVFTNGSVLNASEINDNLMNQAVMVFSNSTTRAAALTAPVEGMLTWLQDTNKYEYRDGSGAWVELVPASSPSGLTLITNFTASAVSSIDINGCFSAAYDNYKIMLRGLTSTGARVQYRMRNAGTTNTAAVYDNIVFNVDGGALSGTRSIDNTSGWIGGFNPTESATTTEIYNPFLARPTLFHSMSTNPLNGIIFHNYASIHRTASSFDSLNLIAGSGTTTITGSIYGYAK